MRFVALIEVLRDAQQEGRDDAFVAAIVLEFGDAAWLIPVLMLQWDDTPAQRLLTNGGRWEMMVYGMPIVYRPERPPTQAITLPSGQTITISDWVEDSLYTTISLRPDVGPLG